MKQSEATFGIWLRSIFRRKRKDRKQIFKKCESGRQGDVGLSATFLNLLYQIKDILEFDSFVAGVLYWSSFVVSVILIFYIL